MAVDGSDAGQPEPRRRSRGGARTVRKSAALPAAHGDTRPLTSSGTSCATPRPRPARRVPQTWGGEPGVIIDRGGAVAGGQHGRGLSLQPEQLRYLPPVRREVLQLLHRHLRLPARRLVRPRTPLPRHNTSTLGGHFYQPRFARIFLGKSALRELRLSACGGLLGAQVGPDARPHERTVVHHAGPPRHVSIGGAVASAAAFRPLNVSAPCTRLSRSSHRAPGAGRKG